MSFSVNPSLTSALAAGLKNSPGESIRSQTPPFSDPAAMKIDPTKPPALRNVSGGDVRPSERPAAVGDGNGDAAQITLPAASGGTAPVDTARVAELRAAVAEGRYQPSGGAIAERLLDFEGAFAGVES